eukprot:4679845-Prymnesium_polylepis.1
MLTALAASVAVGVRLLPAAPGTSRSLPVGLPAELLQCSQATIALPPARDRPQEQRSSLRAPPK